MQLTVQLASVPDRDQVVAEIWCGEQLMAELSMSVTGAVRIELYAKPDGSGWQIDLVEFESVLAAAKMKLLHQGRL